MCIAILNRKGALDKATFMNCWENNPDGAGIAYVENDKVNYFKEMEDLDNLYKVYSQIRRMNSQPMIIHFRIATSGLINEENCHPFEIFPGLVMAHNGIIENVKPTRTLSDTKIFIQDILRRLPQNFLFNEGIRQLITGFIEDSKLVFLNKHGLYTIVNENLGHWDESQTNWYSNYSYAHTYLVNLNYLDAYGVDLNEKGRNRNMTECYSCDSLTYIDDLRYSSELNARLCPDCFSWYRKELSTPYHRTF